MLLKIGKNIASDQILYPRFHSIRSNVITHRAIRNQFISWSLERLDGEFGFEWEKKIDGTRKIEVAKLRRICSNMTSVSPQIHTHEAAEFPFS